MKILPTEFDGKSIRRVYDEKTETWWFSVIDMVQVLTDSNNARRYWSDLKRKLAQEAGSDQPYKKIVQLKMPTPDGKKRDTECATAEILLRLVQSVPSPKADLNSYGFRKGRSTHDARSQLFVSLSQKASAAWVLDADISGFFDNINHDWLLNHVHMDKVMLRKWLKSGVVDASPRPRFEGYQAGPSTGTLI